MVVIKHTSTLLTVYAHNSKILVKEGQNVIRGQKIAEMGNTDTDQVKLHFEVRLQGKPVDPLKYLPPRWTMRTDADSESRVHRGRTAGRALGPKSPSWPSRKTRLSPQRRKVELLNGRPRSTI